MDAGPGTIAALCGAALAAGAIDAIAGGGGLISLPALLAAGLPPHLALGTNKGQSVFGSGAALARYARGGLVDARRARWSFPLGLVGSLLGAALAMWMRPELLRPIVLVLLVAAGVAMAVLPPRKPEAITGEAPAPRLAAAAALAFGIGAYDGFFGPGTGTFLIVAFVALLHQPALRASADAKVVNFASNLAAVGLFAAQGLVEWRIALPMAAAQFAGGLLGAQVGIRRGDRLIRGAVLVVVAALVAKLARDLWLAAR